MAIDFPASPTNGQTFTVGSVTYTWDGTKWTAVASGGGGGVTDGDKGDITVSSGGTVWTVDNGLAVTKLADGTARQLLQTDAAGTAVEWTSNVDIPGTLDVTGATTLDGNLTVDTNTLFVDATNNRVGVGTTSPTQSISIGGLSATPADYKGLAFQSGTTEVSYVRGLVENGSNYGLLFGTYASGLVERMRITSAGFTKHSNTGSYNSTTGAWHEIRSNDATDLVLQVETTSTSYTSGTSGIFGINCATSASSGYFFLTAHSGNYGDREFNLRGDGTGLCDGSWTGGGADYAEYFEWSDGNLDADDRRGIAVVLDGDKIRPALAGEDPIGVISGNPSVVGDSAWNKWSGKYLRDDYGTYIQEDYEVVNDEGETVVQQRRKLNPAFDPDVEYISREERPEWDCVGLMGKLRIRKGQPTSSRWIKMRDISDSVEEWLVR